MHTLDLIPDTIRSMRRLRWLLAVSLCIHLIFLMAWQLGSRNPATPLSNALPINVELMEPAKQTKVRKHKPQRQVHQLPRSTQTLKAAQHATTATADLDTRPPTTNVIPQDANPKPVTVATRENENINDTPTPPSTRSALETRKRIEALLLTDLTRHFQYPLLARQRGWQGTVTLSVTITPDGILDHIHVMESSGYDVLDRSAVDTMRRIGHLAQARYWLDEYDLKLILPVVYRLTN